MDSVGIGELPDAPAYGDQGSNTVGNIAKQIALKMPTLRSLGLDQLVQLGPYDPEETAKTAKTAEVLLEKDISASSAVSAVSPGSSFTRRSRPRLRSAGTFNGIRFAMLPTVLLP